MGIIAILFFPLRIVFFDYVTFVATVSSHLCNTARPPAPSYSCALSNGSGNMTRLTLTWTQPPSDDNITQYCINSSPEYPFANSVCVTPNVRMYHYDVHEGLEYNFTLFAVNCGLQNGTKTTPILVFPQGVCVYVYWMACTTPFGSRVLLMIFPQCN